MECAFSDCLWFILTTVDVTHSCVGHCPSMSNKEETDRKLISAV